MKQAMFDTYKPTIVREVPKSVHVTENRAPTDDSVKLLMEMERAAEDKLVSSGTLENNILSGKFYEFLDHLHQEIKVHVVFMLNGKEYKFHTTIQIYQCNTEQEKWELVFNSFSRFLASEMLDKLIKKAV